MIAPISLENWTNQLVLVFLAYLVVFVVHELIHMIFFKIFSNNKAKLKLVKDKELNAFIVKQLNPNIYYSRFQTIVTLLAPLVLLNSFMLMLLVKIELPIVIYASILGNTLASCIDCYVSLRLLVNYDKNILVNYSVDKVNMNIYKNIDAE